MSFYFAMYVYMYVLMGHAVASFFEWVRIMLLIPNDLI